MPNRSASPAYTTNETAELIPLSAKIFRQARAKIGGAIQRQLRRFRCRASAPGRDASQEGRHRGRGSDVGVCGIGCERQNLGDVHHDIGELQGLRESLGKVGEFIHGRDLPTHQCREEHERAR